MTLDEAIEHAEEMAKIHCVLKNKYNQKCAEEHRQLAEWLKELKAYRESADLKWMEVWEDDPSTFPPVDEDGCSECIWVSFNNADFICIAQYRVDENGGAFYKNGDDASLLSQGLVVNAWMPLPSPWKPEPKCSSDYCEIDLGEQP